MPNGVFAPYTSIPTNILFFDRSGPTREVWYYEQPLPEGRKNHTKTAPIQLEEFAPLVSGGTSGTKFPLTNCWPTAAILTQESARQGRHHSPAARPTRRRHSEKEQRIGEIMGNIQKLLAKK